MAAQYSRALFETHYGQEATNRLEDRFSEIPQHNIGLQEGYQERNLALLNKTRTYFARAMHVRCLLRKERRLLGTVLL